MKICIAALLAGALGSAVLGAERTPPNIVLVLSDDMGFSDLGCYGSEIQTPTLDRLAAGGLRFTQFYNTARCCPTRASLLTGLHPHQAGMGHMTGSKAESEAYAGNLNTRCVTIAEALKPAGYRTYMCGKWHVTRHDGPAGPTHTWPLQRGFDKFYGTITGAGSFYDPTSLCRGNTFITPDNDPEYKPQKFYYTDAISDNAVKFLQEHQREQPAQPFFLYVAYTAAHWPMHALPEDIAKYRGRYDGGYEPIRAARFARQKQLGLIDARWSLSPQAGDWSSVSDKAWEARCMEVYAAMIDRLDQGLGRIVAELQRLGRWDNTLILFLQDNGGCAEAMGRRSNADQLKEVTYKPFGPNDLQPAIWPPMQTRDGRPVRTGPEVLPGPEDTYIAYGQAWANVSNTPFREYKHWVHEGGIATPLIAHWPRGIAGQGELRSQPGQLPDIMATCLDVAGAKYPAEFRGQPITPLEGRSLVPAFVNGTIERDGLFWEHEGNRAVRVGDWKLVAKNPAGPWELYDMRTDRTELHDLAAQQPDRVRELTAKWEAWAKRAQVLPWMWKPAYGQPPKSSQTRFELAPNADLPGDDSPDIVGRAFTVSVEIAEPARDGVLVAQGGSAHGWALYFADGRLHFALRRQDKLEVVTVAESEVAAAKKLTATLNADGTARLTADGREVAACQTAGLLTRQPVDGLQVGRDKGGAVGPYKAPFPFRGQVRGVVVELKR